MEYDRRLLIIDSPEGPLQRLALQLLDRGLSVHYANDPAEAQLLAREAHGCIGVALFAPCAELGPIPELARRLTIPAAALVPTGDRPSEDEVASLASQGVRWHLWDDPSDETIRFVIASVMSDHDPMELRFHLRVPTRVAASLEIGELKGEVTIRDLSLGGACLLGYIVGSEGERGVLHFELGEEELDLPARICWRVEGGEDDVGVAGVSFTEVDPRAGRALDQHIDSVMAGQRITAAES